jgi:cytidine deaminase
VNVENAAYPTSVCAERAAVFNAISEGELRFIAIAVATSNGGMPCGACRQVLAEFGLDILVIVVNEKGEIVAEKTVRDLLPGSFGPDDLPK